MNKKNMVIAVIGLGYVGLPVAIAFSKKHQVVAYDINTTRVDELKAGIDKTKETLPVDLFSEQLLVTSNENELREADIYIVTVPTPIDSSNSPDLNCLVSASKTVSSYLEPGNIVVYESTVYPGATEEVCGPILEKGSSLTSGIDFFLAYSPERINPGVSAKKISDIVKVVSGQTPAVLERVSDLYASIISAGVYEAKSIKVAEAAKVIENTQRDINIAFMNELNIIFDSLDINIYDVLAAARTKWNFVDFRPGLVGGHCIGVDPYYLSYKANEIGCRAEMILSGRHINNSMGEYYARNMIKKITKAGFVVSDTVIGVLGLTFKENCPDVRNTKITDVINELNSFGVQVKVFDPHADKKDARSECGVELSEMDDLPSCDAIMITVAHDEWHSYTTSINKAKILYDIKNCFGPPPAAVKYDCNQTELSNDELALQD